MLKSTIQTFKLDFIKTTKMELRLSYFDATKYVKAVMTKFDEEEIEEEYFLTLRILFSAKKNILKKYLHKMMYLQLNRSKILKIIVFD